MCHLKPIFDLNNMKCLQLKSKFEEDKRSRDTLYTPSPPHSFTYYLNGPYVMARGQKRETKQQVLSLSLKG